MQRWVSFDKDQRLCLKESEQRNDIESMYIVIFSALFLSISSVINLP